MGVLAEVEATAVDIVDASVVALVANASWTRSDAVQDERLVEELVENFRARMRVVAGRYHPSRCLLSKHGHHKACDDLVVIRCQANWNAAGAEPSKRSHRCFLCLRGHQAVVRYLASTHSSIWFRDRICCMSGHVW